MNARQVTAVVIATLALAFCLPLQALDKPPNIIFILADDLGYGDLSSFGSTTIATPNIDKLAENGLTLTDYYAASSVCSPSRAAFLTGRYPYRTGMSSVIYNDSMDGLPPAEITIAEQLQKAGYSTAAIGKWHLGHLDRFMPWNQGFDEFYGLPFSNDMGNLYFYENQNILYEPVDQHYLTQRYTNKALDFIERHQEQPFFLYLAHSMPHVPLYASPKFEGKSKGGLYGDVVEELDDSTGKIIAKLTALNLLDNTLVVFTSDNGPWLMMKDHGGSAGSLRDGKTVSFEGGQRVPAVVHWPTVISAGKSYSGIVNMMDWYTTLSKLAGVPLPNDRAIDGLDILPILTEQKGDPAREFFYLSSSKLKVEGYRQGKWKFKLARSGYPRFLDAILKLNLYGHPELLFDLDSDPEEKHNLADQYPERANQMRERIVAFEASLDLENAPKLQLTATNADRKGFDRPIKSLLIVAIPALLLLSGILYGIYRLLKRGLAVIRNRRQ